MRFVHDFSRSASGYAHDRPRFMAEIVSEANKMRAEVKGRRLVSLDTHVSPGGPKDGNPHGETGPDTIYAVATYEDPEPETASGGGTSYTSDTLRR